MNFADSIAICITASLYDRKVSYQKLGQSITYLDQQNCLPEFKKCWPEYQQLGSQTLQGTVKRVDLAYSRFFQGLGKYPRFKSIRKGIGLAIARRLVELQGDQIEGENELEQGSTFRFSLPVA